MSTWASTISVAPLIGDVPTLETLFSPDTLKRRETEVYRVWITVNSERKKVSVRQQLPSGICSCFGPKWAEAYVWIKLSDDATRMFSSRVFLQVIPKVEWNRTTVYHASLHKALPSEPRPAPRHSTSRLKERLLG